MIRTKQDPHVKESGSAECNSYAHSIDSSWCWRLEQHRCLKLRHHMLQTALSRHMAHTIANAWDNENRHFFLRNQIAQTELSRKILQKTVYFTQETQQITSVQTSNHLYRTQMDWKSSCELLKSTQSSPCIPTTIFHWHTNLKKETTTQ